MILAFAAPAGLAAGFLAWLLAGGSSAAVRQLEPLGAAVAGIRAPARSAVATAAADISGLIAAPLFPLTTGPGAVPQPVLRLDGVVRTARRSAALLAINGQPADWLSKGESRDGVTLLDVSASRALVDTVYGPQDVRLGQTVPEGAPPPAAAPGEAVLAGPDDFPPGFRSPPPPASAPGAAR